MKRIILVIVGLLIGISIGFAQVKTDWERDELKGKVKRITVERITFTEKLGKLEESRDTEYVKRYDDQGKAIDEQNYADGMPSTKIVFDHDEAGRPIEENHLDRGGNLEQKDVYAFDSNGNITDDTSYDSSGILISKDVFKYDEKGRPISWTLYSDDGKIVEKAAFSYDAKGNQTDSDGNRRIKQFNSKGWEIKEVDYAADGSITWTRTYEYDEKGNWIKNIATQKGSKFGEVEDEPGGLSEHRTIEYYE
jgi:antitoxin component YwqK of YwqJK toxin-antitoxin module